jgi:hypothetical protein
VIYLILFFICSLAMTLSGAWLARDSRAWEAFPGVAIFLFGFAGALCSSLAILVEIMAKMGC